MKEFIGFLIVAGCYIGGLLLAVIGYFVIGAIICRAFDIFKDEIAKDVVDKIK
jgi:hypothetical protein